MTSLFNTLKEFKEFKDNPQKGGILHGSLAGIKKKILVLTPSSNAPTHRWLLLKLLLQLAWSAKAIGAVTTGAVMSLLSYFAEIPAQLLRSVINDPDIELHIVEVVTDQSGNFKFSTRGLDLKEQEDKYRQIAAAGPDQQTGSNPFVDERTFNIDIRTTDDLQDAIHSVTIQMWILLIKAVTAPDSARESEQRRWVKYIQQKRATASYKLKNQWLDIIRDKISRDISIRRYMVEILVEAGQSSGTKSRVVETILDIGNYISQTGLASFLLTIKYGIETRFPALALNELQGDLSTMINLMKLYKEQGRKAPYMVILEDSIQTKFAPGGYPLIYSFAMGVGTALDKQMNNLNFNRSFLEMTYFRLGQDIVQRMEGNVDTKLAEDLGLTAEQIADLKSLVKNEASPTQSYAIKSRVSGFAEVSGPETEEETMPERPTIAEIPKPSYTSASNRLSEAMKNKQPIELSDFESRMKRIAREYKEKYSKPDTTADNASSRNQPSMNNMSSSDMDVMDAV